MFHSVRSHGIITVGGDEMGQNVVQEFSHVHDNQINAYHVDITTQSLRLETTYEDKESTEIVFTGLMAHSFENVIYCNIILDITQVTVDYYINSNKDFLERSLRYAFPAYFDSIEKLKNHLEVEKYNIYEISSSLGLTGTVIAKNISINVTELK